MRKKSRHCEERSDEAISIKFAPVSSRSLPSLAMTAAFDRHIMGAALALARRGLGNVWPNPAVGCVIVNDGRVVGRGWTQPGGRPHAETEAITRAGDAARGGTAYVTLEPCCHWGQTPPCAEALIASGVAPRRRRGRGPGPARRRRRSRAAARGRHRRRKRAVRRGGGRDQCRVLPARANRTAARHAEARDLARWPHRDRLRRKPLDHRPGGARAHASVARDA